MSNTGNEHVSPELLAKLAELIRDLIPPDGQASALAGSSSEGTTPRTASCESEKCRQGPIPTQRQADPQYIVHCFMGQNAGFRNGISPWYGRPTYEDFWSTFDSSMYRAYLQHRFSGVQGRETMLPGQQASEEGKHHTA